MPADPRVGMPSYSQGIARVVGFYDRANVLKTGQNICVRSECYHNVLVIDEWSPLAPHDGHQRKYYAPGVGGVFVVPAGGNQQETLSLVSVSHLSPNALAETREGVLQTDRRAYTVNRAYQQTPPAVPWT